MLVLATPPMSGGNKKVEKMGFSPNAASDDINLRDTNKTDKSNVEQ